MRVSLIAALTGSGVIGRDGGLPWHLPDDLRHFKRRTQGHCILMGRRTFESIGRALPGRTSIVLTRNPSFEAPPGVLLAASFDGALELARGQGESEAIAIGGAAIYAEALPRADTLYLTRVHAEIEGDVTFPDFDPAGAGWQRISSEEHDRDDRHAYAFTIEHWERR